VTNNGLAAEGVLTFDFHASWEKADDNVPAGLMSVDFIVDAPDFLYLIEVKDFEHPRAPIKNKKRDYKKLTDPATAFPLEIGMKVKDTLLKQFASSFSFEKPVKFLLVIKMAKLEPSERTTLYEWTQKYIPAGLKKSPQFTSIEFDITSPDEMESQYGFGVTVQQSD
jgi:hypothetical protein